MNYSAASDLQCETSQFPCAVSCCHDSYDPTVLCSSISGSWYSLRTFPTHSSQLKAIPVSSANDHFSVEVGEIS